MLRTTAKQKEQGTSAKEMHITKQSTEKVQAFRLPVAQGKSDLVEAFEKDFHDP